METVEIFLIGKERNNIMKKKKKIFNIILSLLFGFQQFFFFPMEIYYSDKLSFALIN